MRNRIFYLDHLRVALTMLVIIFHTAIAYGASGSWYLDDVDKSKITVSIVILTIFVAICQAFFMGLFFFLSGFFTPLSYDRKGASQFLKERFIRLGIPTVLYFIWLGPTTIYISHYRTQETYWHFFKNKILTAQVTNFGPLWFTEALLYFAVLYVLFRLLFKIKMIKIPFPTSRALVISCLCLGITAFFVRLVYPTGTGPLGLQLGYFPSYIFLYAAGIFASRQNWLDQLQASFAKKWLMVSLAAIPVLPIGLVLTGALNGRNFTSGGLNDQALLYALWEPFVAIGICLGLLTWFKHSFNQPSALTKALSDRAYTAYIIHPVMVVSYTILFHEIDLFPLIKFAIVGFLSVLSCFTVSYLVLKIPYAKKVL